MREKDNNKLAGKPKRFKGKVVRQKEWMTDIIIYKENWQCRKFYLWCERLTLKPLLK